MIALFLRSYPFLMPDAGYGCTQDTESFQGHPLPGDFEIGPLSFSFSSIFFGHTPLGFIITIES